jgi:hypothetical protein
VLRATYDNLLAASPEKSEEDAKADVLAALVAVWDRKAGPLGITRCMRDQLKRVASGQAAERLTVVMRERGLLTPLQTAVLTRYVLQAGPSSDDSQLLRAASAVHALEGASAQQLARKRSAGRLTGRRIGPALLTALDEELMTDEEAKSVLRHQQQTGDGILHVLDAAGDEDGKHRRAGAGAKKGWLGRAWKRASKLLKGASWRNLALRMTS